MVDGKIGREAGQEFDIVDSELAVKFEGTRPEGRLYIRVEPHRGGRVGREESEFNSLSNMSASISMSADVCLSPPTSKSGSKSVSSGTRVSLLGN